MDNPYAAPATLPQPVAANGPIFFKAGYIAAVTFFGTGIVGGICLCIAEWKNGSRSTAMWLLMAGLILGIGTFLLRMSPPIKLLGLPYNILIAFCAYKYVTSRVAAVADQSSIRYLSGWWAFLVLMLYLSVVVGVILLVALGGR